MGEEAGGYGFDFGGGGGGYGGYDGRVTEWETGLPGCDELTPLSQPLVPPGLAAAFRIPPEPGRTLLDVHRASSATVSRLRSTSSSPSSGNGHAGTHANGGSFPSFPGKGEAAGEDSGNRDNNSAESAGEKAAATKRARLVWTPQLHKRFVEVVAHLGIKSAVPKTIMQLMNVEGLTRENVASHLQKYRLYVKRMQCLSNEGPSASDHIFASTPVPPSLREPQVPHAAAMAPAMYHHHPAPMGGVAAGHGGYYQQQHSGHAVYNGYGGHSHGGGVSSYPHYHHGDQ
uniref:PHYTOCLOCK 1 n=1 Tax=Triticum monococcum subsp. monococcum TaxID=408188 RepID=L8B4L0_TRIMO|nr:PHYTOCLOCK 1 [Triticum monococcum subsp. monococcum]